MNLDGGTIIARNVGNPGGGSTGGNSTFNFNGGTLVASVNNGTFLQGLTNVFVKAGGAKIDTQANSITIAQSLLTDGLSTGGGLTKLGIGTLALAGTNTFTGPTTLSAGTLSLPFVADGGVPSTLGASPSAAANLVFNGGVLQFTGGAGSTNRNFTINSGRTAIFDVPTPGSLLTLTGGAAATTGGLTKTGIGTLSLAGTNLYTGPTTINGGVLAASGTQGSSFFVNNGGHVTALDQAEGTLTLPSLTLNMGSAADFEFGTGATLNSAHDIIAINNPNGLTLGNTGLFLYQTGSTSPFTKNGTYTLFDYNTAFNGSLAGTFSIANSQVGKVYGLANNTTATTIELTIADAIVTEWTNATSNNLWSTAGNWTSGVPNNIGAVATFGLSAAPGPVALNGPKIVGSLVFNNPNSYTLTGGVGDVLTLNNGFGTPSITVMDGNHTISAPVVFSSDTRISAPAGKSLTISGNVSGPAGLTLTDAGTVFLSGNNSYSGVTTINAGTLDLASAAAVAGSSAILEKNGAVLRVSGGTSVLPQPVTLDLAGGTATGVSGAAGGTGNFTFDVTTGAAVTFSGMLSNVSGSLVKRGGGTLTLASAGTTSLSNVGGLGTVIQDGSLVLNGGAAAIYNVTGGELAIGDSTPNQASLTLASGTLNVGTFTSVGRGNGTTGLQSTLNITGGTLNTPNLFTGFDNGVSGFNAAPAINVSGSGVVNATAVRIGESAGSNATFNLSGNAALTVTGDFQIAFGGNATMTVADNAVVTIPLLSLGGRNNASGSIGAGVIRQTGGVVQQGGNFGGDWRIGGYDNTESVAYGAYRISGGTLTTNRNFQIGAFGRGVMDISGTGNVTTTDGFPVVGRFTGGFGLMNVSGGSFNHTTPGTLFIIGEAGNGVVNVSGTGALNVAGNPGGAGNAGGTGGIRLGHAAAASAS